MEELILKIKLFYYSGLDNFWTKKAMAKIKIIDEARVLARRLDSDYQNTILRRMDVSIDKNYGRTEMLESFDLLNLLIKEFNSMKTKRDFISNKVKELKALLGVNT